MGTDFWPPCIYILFVSACKITLSRILIPHLFSVAPDFSGTEITTLGVTMSLTWRKRIHVTYELVTDLPIEPYSAQKMPKVKVLVYLRVYDV